ncbi:hypothetical protein MKX01_036652 [Papaver californicum]|nr:hypothetical protein MKX01_036652 [Papaver californicum]
MAKCAHGYEIWDFALANHRFNHLFNNGMQSTAEITVNAVLVEYKDGFKGIEYKDGFKGIESLVDVCGTGKMITKIVKDNPHIRGINFDLPHVVTTTSVHRLRMLAWIMHGWGDEDCVKILRNCYKAIAKKKNGKVIIVDCVLRPYGDDIFDLVTMAHTSGGKERTEVEWKMLLNNTCFPRYNIIQIPTFPSIIEAFP